MEPHEIREILLDVVAELLEAQLKAIRRLQGQSVPQGPPRKGMSQVDMVQDILSSTPSPLHINDILELIHQRAGQRSLLVTRDGSYCNQTMFRARLDRWQIECNHRDEKTILGVGEAQVCATASVPRHPAFAGMTIH
jgi:hypothetical protein